MHTCHTLRSFFLLVSLTSALVFSVLTLAVSFGRMHQLDFTATVKLQDHFPVRLDDNVAVLVDFGAMEIQAIIFAIVIMFLPLPKKTKLLIAIVYSAGLAITLVGKAYLPHPAPPYMFQRGNQGLSFPGLHVQVESSYPSGHTYRVVFLAILALSTWLTQQKKSLWLSALTSMSILFALLVMLGLIVLGKHWTTDVIGGALLATFLVTGTFWLRQD